MGLHHHGSHDHSAKNNLAKAFLFNTLFLFIEIAGAFFTGSVAIWANAIHDVGDSVTIGLSYFFERVALRDPNDRYTYGYARYSLFSSIVAGIIICTTNVFLLVESFQRFFAAKTPDVGGMTLLAIAGIAVNGFAAWSLRDGSTQHERVISWHFIEDMSGWLAVLIGSIVLRFYPVSWLDPLLAMGLAAFVTFNVLKHLKSSMEIFFQQSPKSFPVDEFRGKVLMIANVADAHDIHVWSLDGKHNVITLHVATHNSNDIPGVKKAVRDLCLNYGIIHSTIEVDAPGESCAYGEQTTASHLPAT